MFYTCTFQKETWNFVNKYNNFLKHCRAPEPDTYSMLLPSCGHLEHRSSSLSKPFSSDGFQSCMGGLRIPAPGLHILRGSDFSSICSKPTRPRPMLWSWLCNSLFTLETTSIPAVLLTWLSQPRWTPLSLWEVPGTSALHWPPREAAEVGAALTSAGPTLTFLFNTLSETDWSLRLCRGWGCGGGCPPLSLCLLHPLLLGHRRPSRDLPLSAVNSPKLTCKQTKLHPNPHPSATPAGASFSFILLLFSVSPGAVSQESSVCVPSSIWRGGGVGRGRVRFRRVRELSF